MVYFRATVTKTWAFVIPPLFKPCLQYPIKMGQRFHKSGRQHGGSGSTALGTALLQILVSVTISATTTSTTLNPYVPLTLFVMDTIYW